MNVKMSAKQEQKLIRVGLYIVASLALLLTALFSITNAEPVDPIGDLLIELCDEGKLQSDCSEWNYE